MVHGLLGFVARRELLVYHEAHQAYQGALGALADLCDETQDLQTARDVLKTLFLWHCAFKETPVG